MVEFCKEVLFKDTSPSVIDHEMIMNAIDNQRPLGEAGRLSREDGIELEELTCLRLEFLNILRIDYLWVLNNLQILCLNNNIIEKIENLETLVHLKELNLSYNKIEVIENLDTLVNLEVLNLFSNLITDLQNMHALKKLHIFSIGNNFIEDKRSIFHLRKLKALRSLNMEGNGCHDSSEYRSYVATCVPQLMYYQYKRITDFERESGAEVFKSTLDELHESEAQELAIEAKEEADRAEAELHADSFIEFLGGRQLFDSLFEKDTDGNTLLQMDEVQEFYKEYETNFLEVTLKLFQVGQERYKVRKSEVQQFFKCVTDAKEDNQKQSQEVMEKFLESKQEIIAGVKAQQDLLKVAQESDTQLTNLANKIQEYTDMFHEIIQTAWKDLMRLEMTLFDQIEETNLNFERSLTELVNNFIEEAQGFFTQLRTFEQIYMENVNEETIKLINVYHDDMLVHEDLRALCEDKELMANAVAASHDIHMQLIDSREDRLVNRAKSWLQNIVNNLQKDEITRNRSKVLEINNFLDIQREEFDDTCQDMFNLEPEMADF